MISPAIFKAYDIRGVVDSTLTIEAVQAIGAAVGSTAAERGVSQVVVGRDGRLSGPTLSAALIEGLRSTGIGVVDIGMVPTPVLYFATHLLGTGTGVEITGSHNPPEYNGLKMMIAGETLHGDGIQALRQRIEQGKLTRAERPGELKQAQVVDEYLTRIVGDVKLVRPMKIAIDCGNGVAGAVAPRLYRSLGCDVIELFCDVDGTFPNHHPDPAHPENLQDLIRCLRETDAELGLAFDGDGDRLGVVTKDGQIIYPDRQIMLFAQDILANRKGGEIIFDVKCTRQLAPWIRQHGGTPTMWRTGHSLIKAKLKETKAPFAGEMSGHLFFNDRWPGFDDGLYAGARLLEILSRAPDASAVLNGLPTAVNTPELQLKTAEGENLHAGRAPEGRGQVRRRHRGDHDRRRARGIPGRFRPGAPVEHDADRRHALRGRQRGGVATHPEGVRRRDPQDQERRAVALLDDAHSDHPRHRGRGLHRLAHHGRTAGGRLRRNLRRQLQQQFAGGGEARREDRRQEGDPGERRRARPAGAVARVPAADRRRDPLRGAEGGGRVGRAPRRLLRQQHRQCAGAARCDGREGRAPLHLQFFRHRLWDSRHAAADGGRAHPAGQSLRTDQGDGRADPARLVRGEGRAHGGGAALLQPDRRA